MVTKTQGQTFTVSANITNASSYSVTVYVRCSMVKIGETLGYDVPSSQGGYDYLLTMPGNSTYTVTFTGDTGQMTTGTYGTDLIVYSQPNGTGDQYAEFYGHNGTGNPEAQLDVITGTPQMYIDYVNIV